MNQDQAGTMSPLVPQARRPARPPVLEAYDAAKDVGSVRLLWLEAALKARRVTESEG